MPARDLTRGRPGGAARPRAGGDASREAVDNLNKYAADFATVLPSHLNPQQWLRLAAGLLRKNPDLAGAALRNPQSFFAALMDCARKGLTPGDTYHLVPIGGEIVGITDYTGEIEMIYRAGMVRSIKCEVVYERDVFEFDPSTDDRPKHRIDWTADDRGQMRLVYAFAEFKDGGTSRVVVLRRSEVEQIRAVSKTAKRSDSPWQQWPDRMWRKTAVKQLTGWVPSSAEYRMEQLRVETAAAATPWGQIEPARDYAELPASIAAPVAGAMPIDARGTQPEQPGQPGQPPQYVDASTGELTDAPYVPADGADVEDPPEDAGEYDPTNEPGFGER